MAEDESKYLSERGRYAYNNYEFMISLLGEVFRNQYDINTNPKGIVNLGAAVNKLMEKEVEERLNQDGVFKFNSTLHQYYFDNGGIPTFRKALVGFYKKFMNAPQDLEEQQLTVLNGSGAALDLLSHSLFDPGDDYITTSPTYARIFTNFNNRSQANPVELVLSSELNENGKNFVLTEELLENKILELKSRGRTAKGFVLIHPGNPLGDIYSKQDLMKFFHVCHKYEMHVILDEVYIMSPFGKETNQPVSVVSMTDVPDPMRTHVVWSFSKDMGLAGMRTGVVYTRNRALQKVLNDFAVYNNPSSIVQYALADLVNDHDWLENFYFPTYKVRLTNHYNFAKDNLEAMGCVVRPSQAGIYVWVSMEKFLQEKTADGEMKLFREILGARVYMVPGNQLYCKIPGWFRIVIAVHEHELRTGLTRLKILLDSKKGSSKL